MNKMKKILDFLKKIDYKSVVLVMLLGLVIDVVFKISPFTVLGQLVIVFTLISYSFFKFFQAENAGTEEKEEKEKRKAVSNFFAAIFIFSIIFVFYILTSPMFWAKKYSNLLTIKETNASDFIVNNPDQIRSVTREMAFIKANKILGVKVNGVEVSTQFELDEGNIIKYKGQEYWLFSLKPSSIFSYFSNKEIPGYVLVSATQPNAKAIFVRKPYKIAKSYFLDNIELISYLKTLGAPTYIHFEIDEHGVPYWVIVAESYKFYGHLLWPKKVYLINAQTGETNKYSTNNVPVWVDKIIEEEITTKAIEYYGKYKNGFWNAIFTQKNVVIPTQYNAKELWLIENTVNPDLMWFTGLTSPNKKDNSLVGAIAVDTKNFQAYYLKDMSGITDEAGAIQSIESALGANAIKWSAVLPMPLIINKNFYWVSSIINKDTHLYQKEGAVKGNDVTQVNIASSLKEIFKILSTGNFNENNLIKNSKKSKKALILQKINKMERELKELKELVKTM